MNNGNIQKLIKREEKQWKYIYNRNNIDINLI